MNERSMPVREREWVVADSGPRHPYQGAPVQRDLVERARLGDHGAFAALARESGDRLYRVATLVLGDSEAAKDALQEALILAWRDIRALREPDAWDAWVTRLTVRTCYRLANRERRRRRTLRVVVPEDPVLASEPSFAILDRDEIERGFLALDPDQRAVLVLHFFLGFPLTEVAVVLGIPAGTVKSRLHRGLAAMRSALPTRAVPASARMRETSQ